MVVRDFASVDDNEDNFFFFCGCSGESEYWFALCECLSVNG